MITAEKKKRLVFSGESAHGPLSGHLDTSLAYFSFEF
jgi:hypothetical protein